MYILLLGQKLWIESIQNNYCKLECHCVYIVDSVSHRYIGILSSPSLCPEVKGHY